MQAVFLTFATGTMIRTWIENVVNPHDLYAIEATLRQARALEEDQKRSGSVIRFSLGDIAELGGKLTKDVSGCDLKSVLIRLFGIFVLW